MQQGYTGPEVCKITGISYRQLDHWTTTSLVDASIRKIANRTVASYNGRAPSKTDIFTDGSQGKRVTFSCWIRRSVRVPYL